MSDQIFLLADQNGALVGHMSFQAKKSICSPANPLSWYILVLEWTPYLRPSVSAGLVLPFAISVDDLDSLSLVSSMMDELEMFGCISAWR